MPDHRPPELSQGQDPEEIAAPAFDIARTVGMDALLADLAERDRGQSSTRAATTFTQRATVVPT